MKENQQSIPVLAVSDLSVKFRMCPLYRIRLAPTP